MLNLHGLDNKRVAYIYDHALDIDMIIRHQVDKQTVLVYDQLLALRAGFSRFLGQLIDLLACMNE
jgi:hypothetical protein